MLLKHQSRVIKFSSVAHATMQYCNVKVFKSRYLIFMWKIFENFQASSLLFKKIWDWKWACHKVCLKALMSIFYVLEHPYKHFYAHSSTKRWFNPHCINGLQFTSNRIFLNKTLTTFLAHLITLLLASFVSKSVNYLSHNEHYKIREKACLHQKHQSIAFDRVFKDPVQLE